MRPAAASPATLPRSPPRRKERKRRPRSVSTSRKMPQMICALGDLLLDVIVRLDGPIAEDTDTYGRTRVGAGGQAANVAAWVAALGESARFIGKRATDPAGHVIAAELERRGVQVAGPVVAAGTGVVVSIATPDGKRTMLSDRGVAVDLRPEELDEAWLQDCEWLHVPVYSLARPPLRDAAIRATRVVEQVSIDLSGTVALEHAGVPFVRSLIEDRPPPTVVFGNEDEVLMLGPVAASAVVVKRGARGVLVRTDAETRELAAPKVAALDSTGAGDAFAAGFLLGGPELGLEAAARCVAQMGAMPSA
jgi:ribokinase